ncbi:hypothetical protein H6S82_01355 [Planktothrix sp. FACHB-1355]|uniref:hypothetical protein n=1 Tax=Planktothrix sp. FACHB-1355 TaxID=2692854 RepID=UPI00168ADDEF|nr:hypothetical protein [Planktothrix sp. FACHB-1355]MBD3557514.1 hypothetical protein [Planktothrix sp. FACHB-1355]
MNNAQLRVRIDSLQASHTQDGTLNVSGQCSFKYYDRSGYKVRPLRFQAYGEAAVALNNGGVGAVHVVSGRLNIFKPNDTNPNHQMLLTVERTVVVGGQPTSGYTPVIPVVPAAPVGAVAGVGANISVPIPVASNGKATAEYSEIPF